MTGVSNDYIISFVESFLDSSTVEHPAVNRRVVGSNPTRGAIVFIGGNKYNCRFFAAKAL